MKYALFIYEDESLYGPGKSGPALQQLVGQHMAFNQELGTARIGGAGLAATASATTVRTTDGQKTVTRRGFLPRQRSSWGASISSTRPTSTARSQLQCGYRCSRTAPSRSGPFSPRDDWRRSRSSVSRSQRAHRRRAGFPFPQPGSRRRCIRRSVQSGARDLAVHRGCRATRPPGCTGSGSGLDSTRCGAKEPQSGSVRSSRWIPPRNIAANYDEDLIPDERLRLIFICCHPAINVEARAALTLRLVCGLSTTEIARAFFVSETTLQQRLVRAKRKIAEAAIPFEVPGPSAWPARLDAVLSTLEIAYAKAYEDATGRGPHAGYAAEILHLSQTLLQLLPDDAEVWAFAALVRFTEARRRARLDDQGQMIPLSEQDPTTWDHVLIDAGVSFLQRAMALDATRTRVLQAQLHALWCSRTSLDEPPPWRAVLAVYDRLLTQRDDAVIRLNRAVAVAEVTGVSAALAEVETLDARLLGESVGYHSVRADLLRRTGQCDAARRAYDAAIALIATPAERDWLIRRRSELPT